MVGFPKFTNFLQYIILYLWTTIFSIGIFNTRLNKEDNDGKQNSADENSEDELGGLFRKVTDKQRKDHSEKDNKDNFDTSFYHIGHYEVQNWLEVNLANIFINIFLKFIYECLIPRIKIWFKIVL